MLQVVLCFLIADAAERIVELVLFWQAAGAPLAAGANPYNFNVPFCVAWVSLDGFLIVLLLLRSRTGLYCTQGFLVLHLAYLALILAVKNPELWLYMSDWGRGRVVATAVLDALLALWLSAPAAQRYLDR